MIFDRKPQNVRNRRQPCHPLSREYGRYETFMTRFWPWRAGEGRRTFSSFSLFAGKRVWQQPLQERLLDRVGLSLSLARALSLSRALSLLRSLSAGVYRGAPISGDTCCRSGHAHGWGQMMAGVLNLRKTTLRKFAAVPRRARI